MNFLINNLNVYFLNIYILINYLNLKMNIMTIQNLCSYLEEIGIIDQKSVTPFLTLYSHTVNKINNYNQNENPFYPNNKYCNIAIYEIVLCGYLKKIFNVEKNFQIFSHKIVDKFKQNYLIKQYNGLVLLFMILSKKLNCYKIDSYYKFKYINSLFNENNENNEQNEIYYEEDENYSIPKRVKNFNFNTNDNFYINKNKNNMDSIPQSSKNYKRNYISNISNNISIQSSKDKFNRSVDFKKRLKWSNSKNNNVKTDIQLENKKTKFLKQIQKEHNINFKKTKSSHYFERNNSNYNISNNNSKNINYIKYNIFKNDKNKEIDNFVCESGRDRKNSEKKEENSINQQKKITKCMSNEMVYRQRNNRRNNVDGSDFRNKKESNFINANDIQRMREQLDILTLSSNDIDLFNN